jgi:hypothetical protein
MSVCSSLRLHFEWIGIFQQQILVEIVVVVSLKKLRLHLMIGNFIRTTIKLIEGHKIVPMCPAITRIEVLS